MVDLSSIPTITSLVCVYLGQQKRVFCLKRAGQRPRPVPASQPTHHSPNSHSFFASSTPMFHDDGMYSRVRICAVLARCKKPSASRTATPAGATGCPPRTGGHSSHSKEGSSRTRPPRHAARRPFPSGKRLCSLAQTRETRTHTRFSRMGPPFLAVKRLLAVARAGPSLGAGGGGATASPLTLTLALALARLAAYGQVPGHRYCDLPSKRRRPAPCSPMHTRACGLLADPPTLPPRGWPPPAKGSFLAGGRNCQLIS